MASSSAPVHPARYLSVFLLMLVGVYLLVFLTGDKQAAPKLGIDLQGGTRVTLTARTPDGSRPSREALAQAQQIISARVNGLGVSGSEVVVDGDNLVITVPGNDGNEARNLGQTARLYIRPVLNSMPAQKAPQEPKPASQQPAGTATRGPARPGPVARQPRRRVPGPPGQAGASAPPHRARRLHPAPAPPAAQPRPYPQDPAPTPSPAPSPAPTGSPGPDRRARAAAGPRRRPLMQPAPPDPRKDLAERIAQEKKWRQSTSQYIQMVALQFEATRCDKEDILAGNDDPKLPLVTCSTDHKTAYLLAPSIISGDQIQDATSGMNQTQHRLRRRPAVQERRRRTPGLTTPPPTSVPRRPSPWTRRSSAHR